MNLSSAGGRVGRYSVKSTGLRLSPCGVPMEVAKARQSLAERRGSSEGCSARRRRIIRGSQSSRMVCNVPVASRSIYCRLGLRSLPNNSSVTR